MKLVAEQKCPACGGALRFDPEKGKQICDYCGSAFDIELDEDEKKHLSEKEKREKAKAEKAEADKKRKEEEIDGFDFNSLNEQATVIDPESLPVYVCQSCGAEIIARAEEMALTCPYCSNNIVLTDKMSGNLRPDGVVPFKITKDNLTQSVKDFYKDKVLLPKDFFAESQMSKVTGVYVPFWIFNGQMDGTMFYDGTTSSTHRDGDYLVTETNHYDLERAVSLEFADVPVDASGRIDDDLMDSMEPFDLKEAKKFDMRYLAGYTADRFDVPKDNIAGRAKKRMFSTSDSLAAQQAGREYESVTKKGGQFRAKLDAKYILLPVYLFTVKYENVKYKFAVNGQTGKVVGKLPIGKSESRAYFWKRAGLITVAAVAAAFVTFMMGV